MFLSMADLVVLAQRNTPQTVGQLPAKLAHAMAMEKPIISTNISDMPEILNGCGVIVEPGDVDTLAQNIHRLMEDEEEATELGKRARQKCRERFSFETIETILTKIFERYQ